MWHARGVSATRRRPAPLGRILLTGAILVTGGLGLGYALGRAEIATIVSGRIPAVAFDAYRTAADRAPEITPSCAVDWEVIAGIGQVESRHGRIDRDREITPTGDVLPVIRGRALDGTGGTRSIPDTDDGVLDGDEAWDRAVGPLQFIPTTWRELGRDGNDDGVADPDNLYDAALTAVAHLCQREPGDYTDRGQLRRALIGYNASGRYADRVLEWIARYEASPLDEVVEAPPAGAGA